MDSFSWLHLTDFHQGMGEQHRLWPALRQAFFDDLSRVLGEVGTIDLVFFTGDLVQSGKEREFAALSAELVGFKERLEALGSRPTFIFVPGNHDLVRPRRLNAVHRELEVSGVREEAVRADLFGNLAAPSEHRKVIRKAFASYLAWWKATATHLTEASRAGRLPGDFATGFEFGSLRVGVVGLNSAFLQLHGTETYERRLALDVAQFHAVCNGDGPGWARQHDVMFLLTHHPVSWLSLPCADHFRTEIAPHFHVHLHGHLHEGDVAPGWGPSGRGLLSVQGRALFGLEFARGANGLEIERSHGYVVGRLERRSPHAEAIVRLWPRIAVKQKGQGGWILAPDASYDPGSNGATDPFVLRAPRSPGGATARLSSQVPLGLRPPMFVERGSSHRLDSAADRILAYVDRGARLVALRGMPGDGKTQVLRQVASMRKGYYVELGDHADIETGLREALSIIVESFGEPSCADRSLRAICATVRHIIYGRSVDPLLLLDAVDAPCSRTTLESLLDAELGGAIVVAGPGASRIAEVNLGGSDLATFEQVFDHATGREIVLGSSEREEFLIIAAAVGFSPIHAQFLAEAVHRIPRSYPVRHRRGGPSCRVGR
jgi:hypothetical protein